MVRFYAPKAGLRTVPLCGGPASSVIALAAADMPYAVLLRSILLVLGPGLLFRRRPHPPYARLVESECEVRIAPANGLYIPRWCMGARPNPHVPTGMVSLVSLECVRGDGVQVIHCGIGCMLYLAGSPRAPLTKATHGGSDGLVLLKLQRRNCCTKLAPCISSLSSVQGLPAMKIFFPPCRFPGAH